MAESACRALGGIIAKFKKKNRTYTYNIVGARVVPILDYCSWVWGYNYFQNIDGQTQWSVNNWTIVSEFKLTTFNYITLKGDKMRKSQ